MTTGKKKTRPSYSPARRRADLTPGEMLKTVRKLQEMSQTDLANASGIEQGAISDMEHGKRAIGPERARKLARALHVHPAVLVFPEWEEDDRPTEASQERQVRVAAKKSAHGGRRVA